MTEPDETEAEVTAVGDAGEMASQPTGCTGHEGLAPGKRKRLRNAGHCLEAPRVLRDGNGSPLSSAKYSNGKNSILKSIIGQNKCASCAERGG